jgi:transport and Golgi organization protein 2
MCSVSFIPRQDGFVLAMNRDELISRVAALPPRLHDRGDLAVLCPSEPSGGTWIGVNSAGMAFSLLNWHSQPDRATDNLISRGEVVRTLLCSRSTSEAGSILKELPLRRMNPFRLVAVNLAERSLVEWCSGIEALTSKRHPWKRQHWFSSGFDEARAIQVRRGVCAQFPGDLEDLATLRKLHATHLPSAGPFSLCMHREDAATVSYTELSVRDHTASMSYISESPCSPAARFLEVLSLDPSAIQDGFTV